MDTALVDYANWVLRPPLPDRPTQPSSSYFICGTPRSGSWLLCGLLASAGVAGRPHEWFWRDTEQANMQAWGVSSFSDYLKLVHGAGTTPNGTFGSKLMWGYFEDVLTRLRELGDAQSKRGLIARHFPKPQFVWIRREDIIAQAVSWAMAVQTGRWHQWDTPDPSATPVYDRGQIDALARQVAAHNEAWWVWFAANEVEPFAVCFEELVANPVSVTQAVLGFLGAPSGGVPIRALTVSTRERSNDAWLAACRV